MESVKVKICGIKSLEDGLAAVEAGADLLGFNFYSSSPRFIKPDKCARIVFALRERGVKIQMVGVFVNETAGHITYILEKCGLDFAQLSGDEPPEVLQALGEQAFKGLRILDEENGFRQAGLYAQSDRLPAILIDSLRPGFYGGTGQKADWDIARRLAARYPLLLAGGLHPGNVAQAISHVHPWGVDVASGVENTPERKDFQKMRAFIQAARNVDQEVEQC